MDFGAVVDTLRSWEGRPVLVVLEPDHSVMEGPLREIDSGGIDGAMFTVSPTGGAVAIALFRDAFEHARVDDEGTLRVVQGRVEILVTPATDADAGVSPPGGTAAPRPAR